LKSGRSPGDGIRQEIVRFGRTRREAEASLEAAVAAVLRGADAVITRTMPLLEAGECWLEEIRDLIAFLAGTGARIDEARRVRWQDINLERGRVYLRGTKAKRPIGG
jgi:integrase